MQVSLNHPKFGEGSHISHNDGWDDESVPSPPVAMLNAGESSLSSPRLTVNIGLLSGTY